MKPRCGAEAEMWGSVHKSPGDTVAVGLGAALWNPWFMTSSCPHRYLLAPVISVTHKNLWEPQLPHEKRRTSGLPGEMAQSVKHLLSKHEGLRSTPSTQVRKLDVVAHISQHWGDRCSIPGLTGQSAPGLSETL